MEIIHNLKGWFIETEIDNICYVINEPGNSFKKPSMTCSFWFGRLFFGVKRGGGLGCALTFASEAKFEIEVKISFRLEAKKMPDFT
jgi:hypothetical protein